MSSSMNQAADLALRLSTLSQFLQATEELVVGLDMNPVSIRRHSRKIVRLVEIARNTLRNHSIRLHEFATCAPAVVPYKAAYFNLLKWMRCICVFFDPALKPRVTRLLLPLSSDMVIYRRGSPVTSEYGGSTPEREGSPWFTPWSPTMRRSLSRSPSPPSPLNSMLPPIPPPFFHPLPWVPSNHLTSRAALSLPLYSPTSPLQQREPSSPLWDSDELDPPPVLVPSMPPRLPCSNKKNPSSSRRRKMAAEPVIPPIALPCLPLMPMTFQASAGRGRKEERSWGSC